MAADERPLQGPQAGPRPHLRLRDAQPLDRRGAGGADRRRTGQRVHRPRWSRASTEHRARLDEVISTYAQGWTLDRMPAVDRNVLRHGDLRGAVRRRRARRRRRVRGPATWCATSPPTSRRRSSTACSATSSATASRSSAESRIRQDGPVTSDVEQAPVPRPPGLPAGWTVRTPVLDDLDVLVALRGADRLACTGSAVGRPGGHRVRGRRTGVLDPPPAARRRPRRTRRAPGSSSTTGRPAAPWSTLYVDRSIDEAGRRSPARSTPGPRSRPRRSACCARCTRPGWTRARSPRTPCSSSGWPTPATPSAAPGRR